MKKIGLFFLLFFAMTAGLNAQKPQVWMIGPMLHFNFGDKQMHTSFGVELAYWNYEKFPYSIDGGIEFEKGKLRFYTEGQTGIGLLGISMGPVMEFRKEMKSTHIGFQGSVWANYFGGIDLRYRAVGGTSVFSPGLYFKLPLGLGDSDGDFDDWDWDD